MEGQAAEELGVPDQLELLWGREKLTWLQFCGRASLLSGSINGNTNTDCNTNTDTDTKTTLMPLSAWKEETHKCAGASPHTGHRVPKPGMGLQPFQLGPGRHLDCAVQVGWLNK